MLTLKLIMMILSTKHMSARMWLIGENRFESHGDCHGFEVLAPYRAYDYEQQSHQTILKSLCFVKKTRQLFWIVIEI